MRRTGIEPELLGLKIPHGGVNFWGNDIPMDRAVVSLSIQILESGYRSRAEPVDRLPWSLLDSHFYSQLVQQTVGVRYRCFRVAGSLPKLPQFLFFLVFLLGCSSRHFAHFRIH